MTLFVSLFVIKTVGTTDLRLLLSLILITNELGHGLIHTGHGCREGTRVQTTGVSKTETTKCTGTRPFVRGGAHLLGLAKKKGEERHHGDGY